MIQLPRWPILLASSLTLLTSAALAGPARTYQVFDAQGAVQPWPAPLQPLRHLGHSGQLLAQQSDTLELGLVQPGGPWRSLGLRGPLATPGDDEQALHTESDSDSDAPLLFLNGKLSTQRYLQPTTPLEGGLLVAARNHGDVYDVLHGSGKVLLSGIPKEQAIKLSGFGKNVLLTQRGQLWLHALYAPPRLVGRTVHRSTHVGQHVLWHDAQSRLLGVVPLSGHGLRTSPAWQHTADATDRNGLLWLQDAQHNPLAILKPNGEDLLSKGIRQRLRAFHLQVPLEPEHDSDTPSPIVAHVVPELCPCNSDVHGALLANGQVLMNTAWSRIIWLGQTPGSTTPPSHRFAVQSQGQWSLVDERGHVLTRHAYDVIQPMQHGQLIAARKGRFELLDADGRATLLPDFLELRAVSPRLLAYLPAQGAESRWGLYDAQQRTTVSEPTWRHVEHFQHERAVATAPDGQLGLIDTQGRWVIPARFQRLRPLSPGLWTGTEATADADTARWTLWRQDGTELETGLSTAPKLTASWVVLLQRQNDGRHQTVLYRGQDAHRLPLPGAWSEHALNSLLVLERLATDTSEP